MKANHCFNIKERKKERKQKEKRKERKKKERKKIISFYFEFCARV